MIRKELFGDDAKPNSFANHVIENAIGPILKLDSAPTAAIPQLEGDQIGYFNNKIYLVIEGVLKEFSISNTA